MNVYKFINNLCIASSRLKTCAAIIAISFCPVAATAESSNSIAISNNDIATEFANALKAINNNQPNEAKKELESYTPKPRQLREQADRSFLLGMALQQQENHSEAIQNLDQAINLRPAFSIALLAKAESALKTKEYETARSAFDEALFFGLKNEQNQILARRGLLESLRALNRNEEADKLNEKFKAAGLL